MQNITGCDNGGVHKKYTHQCLILIVQLHIKLYNFYDTGVKYAHTKIDRVIKRN